jgi:uncharacterized Zn finger protein
MMENFTYVQMYCPNCGQKLVTYTFKEKLTIKLPCNKCYSFITSKKSKTKDEFFITVKTKLNNMCL